MGWNPTRIGVSFTVRFPPCYPEELSAYSRLDENVIDHRISWCWVFLGGLCSQDRGYYDNGPRDTLNKAVVCGKPDVSVDF